VLLLVGGLSVAAAVRNAISYRYSPPTSLQGARSGLYGELFTTLHKRGVTSLLVIDPGFVNEDMPHYAPVLRAYRLLWASRSMTIDHATDPRVLGLRHSGIVASCDRNVVATLGTRIRDIGGVPGCVAGTVPLDRGGAR
jgi:hypothetical protein